MIRLMLWGTSMLLLMMAGCEKSKTADKAGQAPRGMPAQAGPGSPHALPAPTGQMPSPHGAPPAGANPHGAPMGQAPAVANFDPTMVIEGTIFAGKGFSDKIKAGDLIFLTAKLVDAESGEVVRFPLAVDRLDVSTLPMKFTLSGKNSMMAGTKFEGTVMVNARVDRDGEARTKEPGDIEGQIKLTIPKKDVKLVLDTPIK